jgi:hypothetical protein
MLLKKSPILLKASFFVTDNHFQHFIEFKINDNSCYIIYSKFKVMMWGFLGFFCSKSFNTENPLQDFSKKIMLTNIE